MWKHPQGEAFSITLVVAGLILLNIFQYTHLQTVNSRLSVAQSAMFNLQQDVASLKQRTLNLENASSGAPQAQTAPSTPAPEPPQQQAGNNTDLQKQLRIQRQLQQEVQRLRAAASTTDARLTQVSAEVGSVRSDLAAKDATIDRSMADLKRVMGDLGVQSNLIATNRKELDTLRASGDRYYFDFALSRDNQPKRVSDVGMLLKKADPKRSRFTIELVTSDKRIEKRDRTLNEPIQFYVRKRVGPYEKETDVLYEVVVNEIKPDKVIGYLTTPKGLSR